MNKLFIFAAEMFSEMFNQNQCVKTTGDDLCNSTDLVLMIKIIKQIPYDIILKLCISFNTMPAQGGTSSYLEHERAGPKYFLCNWQEQ